MILLRMGNLYFHIMYKLHGIIWKSIEGLVRLFPSLETVETMVFFKRKTEKGIRERIAIHVAITCFIDVNLEW